MENMPDWFKTASSQRGAFPYADGYGSTGNFMHYIWPGTPDSNQWVIAPGVKALGFSWNLSFTWLGIQTTSNSFYGAAGVAIVVLALVIGWIIYRLMQPRAISSPSANVLYRWRSAACRRFGRNSWFRGLSGVFLPTYLQSGWPWPCLSARYGQELRNCPPSRTEFYSHWRSSLYKYHYSGSYFV